MMDPSNELVVAIARANWEEVLRQCQAHPERAREWHVEANLFQGQQESLVLPLHQALTMHDPPTFAIQALVEAHPVALLTKEATYERLPLHLATQNPTISTEIVQLLLCFVPEVAMEHDAIGRLALHYACANGASLSTVNTLLKAFPRSVSIPDVNGWLPIHVACRSEAPFQVVQRLLDAYPASIVAETNKGNTPTDMLLCQNILGRQSTVLSDTSLTSASRNKQSYMDAKTPVAEQMDVKMSPEEKQKAERRKVTP